MKKLSHRRHRWLQVYLCIILLPFFNGCELVDIINKACRKFWQGDQYVSVLIAPPYPFYLDRDENRNNQQIAEMYADNVKDAFMRGIQSYNDLGNTTIRSIYYSWNRKDVIDEFYKGLFMAIKDAKKSGGDWPLRQQYRKLIEQNRSGSCGRVTCLICGFYMYKPNASANNFQLVHYDAANDTITEQRGVVAKEKGRAQDNDFENLMKTLLEKAYGK